MSKPRKRKISDEEVALIKGMLQKKIPNDHIHFYFNREDRLVSSGRITQIKQGKYGKDIAAASETEIDAFIADWKRRRDERADAIASRAPTDREVILALFEMRGRKSAFLKLGETAEAECKLSFSLRPQDRFADALRSIAGLANNKGGYVFFGIKDKTYEVVGLQDNNFKNTDNSEFNRVISTALDPVPRYEIVNLEIEGKALGVIYVWPSEQPPIVATKGIGKDLAEGTIYFRYLGESKPIKPGELRQIIALREQKAVTEFARSMIRVADGTAATLDLETGKVAGRAGAFIIDKELLSDIQFIREGEFDERRGAPTLRLIGEVSPSAQGQTAAASIIRKNVIDDAVLKNFLEQSSVAYPLDYVQRSCHTQRHWLPIFYYMKMASLSVDQAVALFDAEPASYPKVGEFVRERLRGVQSAFRATTGAGTTTLAAIQLGQTPDPKDAKEAATMAYAVGGLSDATVAGNCLVVLQKCLALARGPKAGALRSVIYRAACRLDELMFRPA